MDTVPTLVMKKVIVLDSDTGEIAEGDVLLLPDVLTGGALALASAFTEDELAGAVLGRHVEEFRAGRQVPATFDGRFVEIALA